MELSLVAGAPHSFIQQLSEPYYGRRPVVPLPESVQLSPQTHAATLVPSPGMRTGAGIGAGVPGGMAGGSIGGVMSGQAPVSPRAMPRSAIGGVAESVEVDAAVEDALQEGESAAEGTALSDLFEYKLRERVTIRKNQSALVPIVQTDIAADKVSLWNESQGMVHPLRAVWLNNSSALTLEGGSFSVLDENTFAGEGLLQSIRPGERRLLSYATDLGLVVDTKMESEQERVTHASIRHGLLTTKSELREKKTYIVRNEDTSMRTLIVEHLARPEWKLAEDAPKPEEKAPGLYRFRLNVASNETARLTVNESKPSYVEYTVRDITDDQVTLFLQQKRISLQIEKALHPILEQKNAVANLNALIQLKKQSIDPIFADQVRLRENMKALKGSPEERALLQRYTRQLDEEETDLDRLRKEMKETEAQRDKAKTGLDQMIESLQVDATL